MLQPVVEPPEIMDRRAYRTWAAERPGRYERIDGVLVAMAPERVAHARLKAAAYRLLRDTVRANGLPCEALPDGLAVEVGDDHDFEPDAMVRCGDRLPGDATTVSDPVIVVEVLSPSTAAIDRSVKLAEYFRLPSVQHYLIVWPDQQRVVHHRRDGGRIETTVHDTGEIALSPPGLMLDLAELYAD